MSWQRKAQFQSVGPCLVFVYFVWNQLLRLSATNCWVQKSARLYNNCKYSGVGSDCGRGDLYNVIFNSLDIHHVFVSILVIRKGPTPFSLLSQSRPSHYPRSEEYGRIAFLLPTKFLSFYGSWRQKGSNPLYAQICWTVTFDGTAFHPT